MELTPRERQVQMVLAEEAGLQLQARYRDAKCKLSGHRWQDVGAEYRECLRCGATTEPRDDYYDNP